MHIGEIMTKRVDSVSPSQPLVDAAKRMRDDDIGALPVIEDGKLVGMITDRDIVVRAVAEKVELARARVRDAMSTTNVIHCRRDDTVEEASRKMAEAQVRRLPVLDDHEHVVGIVSLADLARHEDTAESGKTLREISEPPHVPWPI
jgi:CBS domain-containing protein